MSFRKEREREREEIQKLRKRKTDFNGEKKFNALKECEARVIDTQNISLCYLCHV